MCHRGSRARSSSAAQRSSAGLEAAFSRAEGGVAGAAFVCGESGIGKTRLLRELERRAADRGARVLRGECQALGAGEQAYAPIASALRRLARELEPPAFETLVGPARGELARLVPEWGSTAAPSDRAAHSDASAQAWLFGTLRGLLDRLAADGALLFAVEDLHWADRSTLELLSLLLARPARRARAARLHLPHATSCTAATRCGRSLAEEERRAAVQRFELEPSRRDGAARAQVAGILGRPPGARERSRGCTPAARATRSSPRSCWPPAQARRLRRRPPCATALVLRVEALRRTRREVLRVAAAAGSQRASALLATVAALPEARCSTRCARRWPQPRARRTTSGRLRLPPRPAPRGRLRRPAARRAGRAAPRACRGADRRPGGSRARRPRAELAHHWHAAHRHARGARGLRAGRPRGRAGLGLRRGRAAVRARPRGLGRRRGRRRALRARAGRRRRARGARRPLRGRAPPGDSPSDAWESCKPPPRASARRT